MITPCALFRSAVLAVTIPSSPRRFVLFTGSDVLPPLTLPQSFERIRAVELPLPKPGVIEVPCQETFGRGAWYKKDRCVLGAYRDHARPKFLFLPGNHE